MYFASQSGSPANMLSNATVTWNQLGDSTSCTTPMNAMTDYDSPEDYQGGCAGIVIQTSVNGMVVENNNIFHVGEGIHVECGGNCYPNAFTTTNLSVQFNDFSQMHRMAWEEQPQTTSGVVFANNTAHDWLNAYFGSFGLSFACCGQGATSPWLNVSNNIVLQNTTPHFEAPYGYGYGSEDWGLNATYDHNYFGSGAFDLGAPGMTWGYGNVADMSYNTVCGQGFSNSNYIQSEFGTVSPTRTDNVTGKTCSASTSASPTISPSAGPQTFPVTVTLTDQGLQSGSQPLGNTGIWYTTDGSTPVPGSGTAQYLSSGGTFTLKAAATVQAVGMWGAANQPTKYPAGMGFVPSGVISASYTSGGAMRPAPASHVSNRPAGSAVPVVSAGATGAALTGAAVQSVAITPALPVVAIGSTAQLKAIATFNDGSVRDVTADFDWQSSEARIMTANGAGTLSAVASGKATVSGSYQGIEASVPATSSIGEVVWSGPIVIATGGTYSGNWQSTDSKTPAVLVATTEPVTIQNAHIRGAGDLITTQAPGSDLTVRNSVGLALNAAIKGQPNGNFVEVSSPAHLDVENNYVENARGGVILHGYSGSRNGEQTIVIRGNRARNLSGLLSDGQGGYLAGEGSSQAPAHFIQFDSVQAVPHIEVGWNEVVNYPGQSLVAGNIELYRSSGTPNQPLEIHDTYIQGAYPYSAQDAYAGGGIETRGTAGDSVEEAPAFSNIHDNQVVGTVNYGIRFAAGHDNLATNNRVISSGLLTDGTRIAAQDAGLTNGDAIGNAVASGSMYNNTMRDNFIGWMCWQTSCAQQGYRKDQYFPAAPTDYATNSVVVTPKVTLDMENYEYHVWMNKVAAAGINVGPSF